MNYIKYLQNLFFNLCCLKFMDEIFSKNGFSVIRNLISSKESSELDFKDEKSPVFSRIIHSLI